MLDPDVSVTATTTTSTPDRRSWWVLAAMCVPLLAQSLDVSGIGLLLPSIGADLDASATQLAWVMNANALAFGALLLTFGTLADRFGPRRLLLAGVAGFGVASLLCGAATDTDVLIAARALQGLSSAACFTTSLSVVMATFAEDRRPAAIGVWGAVSGAGSALGPLVAGALTTAVGWRAFFFVNGPICLLALPAIATLVGARDRRADRPTAPVPAAGLAAVAVSFVGISLAAGRVGGGSWLSPGTVVPLVAAAGAGIFVVVRRRRGARPVVDPAAVGARWSRSALAAAFTSTWGFGVTLVVVSAYLQQVRGFSALEAGVTFLAFSGAFALAGTVNGPAVRRLGLTTTLVAAMVACAAGFALLATIAPASAFALVVLGLLVGGFGQGLAFAASTTASLTGVPQEASGQATGATQSTRLLGNVAGVALSTAVLIDLRDGVDTPVALARGDGAAMVLALGVSLLGAALVPLLVRRGAATPTPTGAAGAGPGSLGA